MHRPATTISDPIFFILRTLQGFHLVAAIASVDRLKIELSSRKTGNEARAAVLYRLRGETVTLERLTILRRHGLCWFRLRTNSVAVRLPESIAE